MGDVDASPSVSLVDPVVAQAVRATARRKSHEFIAPTQSAAAMATTSSTDSEPLEPKETGVGRQRASLLRENEDVAVAVAVDVRPAASVSGSVTGQEQGAGSGYALAAVQAEERRPERHRSHHGELGAFRWNDRWIYHVHAHSTVRTSVQISVLRMWGGSFAHALRYT